MSKKWKMTHEGVCKKCNGATTSWMSESWGVLYDNKRKMKMTMGDELVKEDEVTMRWWWCCVCENDDDEVVMVTSALCSKCTLCGMRERKDECVWWMRMSKNGRWRIFCMWLKNEHNEMKNARAREMRRNEMRNGCFVVWTARMRLMVVRGDYDIYEWCDG